MKQGKYVVEQYETVVVDGHRLDVIARPVDRGQCRWLLAVENELGIRSVWMEWFATAREALDAGHRAIAVEGAQTFLDVEGFDYKVSEVAELDDVSLH